MRQDYKTGRIFLTLTAKDPIILSFTNKAIENIKSRFQKFYEEKGRQYRYRGFNFCFSIYSDSEDDEEKHKNYSDELDKKCFTFDSYFCEYHSRDITSLKGKTIFIEEYTFTAHLSVTIKLLTRYKQKVVLAGMLEGKSMPSNMAANTKHTTLLKNQSAIKYLP